MTPGEYLLTCLMACISTNQIQGGLRVVNLPVICLIKWTCRNWFQVENSAIGKPALESVAQNGRDYGFANVGVGSIDLKELQVAPQHFTHPSDKESDDFWWWKSGRWSNESIIVPGACQDFKMDEFVDFQQSNSVIGHTTASASTSRSGLLKSLLSILTQFMSFLLIVYT